MVYNFMQIEKSLFKETHGIATQTVQVHRTTVLSFLQQRSLICVLKLLQPKPRTTTIYTIEVVE